MNNCNRIFKIEGDIYSLLKITQHSETMASSTYVSFEHYSKLVEDTDGSDEQMYGLFTSFIGTMATTKQLRDILDKFYFTENDEDWPFEQHFFHSCEYPVNLSMFTVDELPEVLESPVAPMIVCILYKLYNDGDYEYCQRIINDEEFKKTFNEFNPDIVQEEFLILTIKKNITNRCVIDFILSSETFDAIIYPATPTFDAVFNEKCELTKKIAEILIERTGLCEVDKTGMCEVVTVDDDIALSTINYCLRFISSNVLNLYQYTGISERQQENLKELKQETISWIYTLNYKYFSNKYNDIIMCGVNL